MGFKNRVNPEEILSADEIDAMSQMDGVLSVDLETESIEVISGRADLTEKPSYDTKRLSRDFPQIFKQGGKVRKSPAFKKYTLREAMKKLDMVKGSIAYTVEQNEACELSFITEVSLITIKGAAALAIRQNEDFLYDFIDAGWEFYFVGC